jgi:hypothetical protein
MKLDENKLADQLIVCACVEPIVANYLCRYERGEFSQEIAFAGMVVDLCSALNQKREQRLLDHVLSTPVIVMGPESPLAFQLQRTQRNPPQRRIPVCPHCWNYNSATYRDHDDGCVSVRCDGCGFAVRDETIEGARVGWNYCVMETAAFRRRSA